MNSKVCIVTGANAGIGLVTARGLAEAGATVALVCRDRSRGAAAMKQIRKSTGNDNLQLFICDLSLQSEIHKLAADFTARFDRLHVLINNAAIYTSNRTLTAEGIEAQFAANYLGPFLLTNLMLESLKSSAPARIINLSTINHFDASLDLDNLQSEGTYQPKTVHMRTKLALILFTYELARRLEGTSVTANCLHPGVIATNLLGQVRNVAPEERFTPVMGGDPLEVGGRTPLYLATSPDVQNVTGKYFDDCKAVTSSAESYDTGKALRLWQISETLTGLTSNSHQLP